MVIRTPTGGVLAWLLLGLLGVIWGTNFIFMKSAVAVIPPLEVVWLRTLFGAVPIAGFALVTRSFHRRDLRHLHHFAMMALLANVGPYAFFVIGTRNLPSGIAGAISGSIPFITAGIVALALPAEALTRSKTIGIAVGFAGILLIAPLGGAASQNAGASTLLGVAAMLAGSLSYALALVYAKRFIAPLRLGPVRHWSALLAHVPATAGLVVGLGLVGTGLAFVIYYHLISTLGALRAASVYYLPPIVALAVGALFANEPIGLKQIGGAILILAGIFYANRAPRAPDGPLEV
jgi:drug/metabolite transporter (DMT)-like permease